MRIRVLPLAILLLAISSGPPSVASLSLRGHDEPFEGAELPRAALFARVDSLLAVYDERPEGERGDVAMRLGQLYLATGLAKHKRTALDLLDEAVRDGADVFRAARLRAATVHRMRYTGQARRWMEDLVRSHGDDPRAYTMLGRYYFLEGRRRMVVEQFEKARTCFVRAVKADSTHADAWYGLACTALALQQPEVLRMAAERLGSLRPESAGSLFFEGVAHQRLGDTGAAARAYDEALARSGDDVVAVFQQARGFLEPMDLTRLAEQTFPRHLGQAALERLGEDPRVGEEVDWARALTDSTLRERAVALFWTRANTRPTQAFNPERLRYWTRLVEADVLFGDPDEGRRGWDTSMGDALVRWGWPTHTYYDAGESGPRLSDLNARGFRFEPNTAIPSSGPVWVWGYGRQFSLIFSDITMNARWTYTDDSALNAARLRRQAPIYLPEPVEPSPPFRLALSRAIFPRGADQAILETYIGLRPTEDLVLDASSTPSAAGPADTLGVVEWALYDEAGTRIDYRREIVDDHMRRDGLHAAIGWGTRSHLLDPYVIPIGARVPAGRYRIAVEVTGPGGQGHDALALEVEVPPTEPPTILEMSDLQLASAFDEYRPEDDLPLRYVKFGQVVVPVPDLRVPAEANAIGVYFEVRHLGLDGTGRTHFDVTYEVFRSNREVRNLVALREDFRRSDLEPLEPMTMTFLEERTGVSGEGLVVKGTRVDVADLGAGDYVLVVTLRDRVSGREASEVLPFRKRGF